MEVNFSWQKVNSQRRKTFLSLYPLDRFFQSAVSRISRPGEFIFQSQAILLSEQSLLFLWVIVKKWTSSTTPSCIPCHPYNFTAIFLCVCLYLPSPNKELVLHPCMRFCLIRNVSKLHIRVHTVCFHLYKFFSNTN